MGRRALFSQEEVFQTADRLAAEGKEVSATTLLAALGGGSLTTIYKHLTAWLEARPKSDPALAPIEIPDMVQGAFTAAWRTAVLEATREVAVIKEKAAEEVKTAQKKFQEALEQIERLEREGEADGAQIEGLTSRIGELEAALHKLESEASGHKASADQLREQVKAQQEDLDQLRKEKDAAVNAAAELRGEAKTLRDQNNQLLARLPEPKKNK